MTLQPIEARIFAAINDGQFEAGRELIDEFARTGASAARLALYRGAILGRESDQHQEEAIEILTQVAQAKGEPPDTYAMAYIELSHLAYMTNQRGLLRRVHLLAEQLWMVHGDAPDVRRWRGHLLVNLALFPARDGDHAQALAILDEAAELLSQFPEHWPQLLVLHMRRSRALAQLGRIDEAAEAMMEAQRHDQDGTSEARLVMGRAWLAFVRGDSAAADRLAAEAAKLAEQPARPDWWIVMISRYLGLEIAVAQGREDALQLAEDLRVLASRHHFSFAFHLIKEALRKYRPNAERQAVQTD